MAIEVGIIDNLRITKAEKNDKGTLQITIVPADADAAQAVAAPQPQGVADIFGELNDTSQGSAGGGNQLNYLHWPYKIDEYVKTSEDVLTAIRRGKEFFNHILLNYMTEDKVRWNVMQGIQFPNDAVAAKEMLLQEAVLKKVYENQITQFMMMIAPHIGETSPLFRFKLVRQSKAKHYASLPKFAPFMEPMTVPKAQSKLAFSTWEKDNGFDSGTPLPEAETQPDATPAEEAAGAANIFGN